MDLSFSISMPIGQWHPFLPAALASLLSQNADVRIAFLDASGDPRVKALADSHGDKLAFRRHGPDGGQSAAILEGWANATGAILGWLNADDILMPGALEAVVKTFTDDPQLDVVCGHSVILDDAARMVGYHWAVEPPGPRLLEAGIVSQPSCFFRRSAYDAAGGLDEDLHYTMDWDLWIRLYASGAKFGFIDAPLSQVLWGDDTKTASFNPQRRAELRRIIDAYAPPEKRRKIFRAFALHNLMNRIRPPTLKAAVSRALKRGRAVIYGLGADGRIETGARLHLAHYDTAPMPAVRLVFDNAAVGADVGSATDLAEIRCDGRIIDVIFNEPVAPASGVVVSVAAPPGERLYFKHAEWTADAQTAHRRNTNSV